MTNVRADAVRRPLFLLLVVGGLIWLATMAWMRSGFGGAWVHMAVIDLTTLGVVLSASAASLWAAFHQGADLRRSWLALGVGLVGAVVGQSVWTYHRLVLERPNAFPSWVDAGFLVLPLGAAACLALFPSTASVGSRPRHVLDALMVGAALMIVSSTTALGAAARGADLGQFAFVVSLAYPTVDLIVLTMVVLTFSRVTVDRRKLLLVGAGMTVFAVFDSAFTYLSAIGYTPGDLVLVGWLGGFILLGVAPFASADTARRAMRSTNRQSTYWLLPYVPLAVAGIVLVGRGLSGQPIGGFTQVLVALMVVLLLVRQFATMRVNAALSAQVASNQDELRHQALHDALTGLPNRALVLDRVEQALARGRRLSTPLAAMFLDLDGFKTVNDTCGHATGDQLLCAVADRLSGVVRDSDTVGRLGGDEFLILVEGGSLDAGPEVVAERIHDVLAEPFRLGPQLIHVRASIGIAVGQRSTADELLRDADTAMYEAKNSGKGHYVVFVPAMQTAVQDVLDLEADLRAAITMLRTDRDATQFVLDFQPTIDLDAVAISGVAVLVGWQHPTRGRIVSDTFMPIAEEIGLAGALGRWVLDQVCMQAATWQRRGHSLPVWVKITSDQLHDRDLPRQVAAALQASDLEPARLTLEIAESTIMKDGLGSAERLRMLKTLGVRIAIDNFGTGYSSLGYLQQFPIDALKIDRSFISRLAPSPEAPAVISALSQLARALGTQIVAEGIDDHAKLQHLQPDLCDIGDGYLYPRPLSAHAVDVMLGDDVPTGSPSDGLRHHDVPREAADHLVDDVRGR